MKPIGYLLYWKLNKKYFVFCSNCAREAGFWAKNESNGGLWSIHSDSFGYYVQKCGRSSCRVLLNKGFKFNLELIGPLGEPLKNPEEIVL